MDLSTIPRASSISNVDGNIGSNVTININTASSSFRHTVTYAYGNFSGTIANKTSQTSITWQLPISFFQSIPRAMNGQGTLTCYTYNGDTLIGTKTSYIIARVPTSGTYNSTPIIDSASVIDTNEDTIALTNDNTRLVNYQSNVEVNASGRTLNYGEFKQVKSNNEVMTSSTSSSSGTTTITAEKIHNSSIAAEYKIVLEDKRGLSVQKVLNETNQDFTLVPYIPITMSLNVERISPVSDSIILNFSGNFYNGYYDANNNNFNDITIKWRYKEAGGDWITTGADDVVNGWHNLTLGTDYQYTQDENNYTSIGNVALANLFDYQKQYIVEVYYGDRLTSYTTQKTISQGVPVYDTGVDAYGNNYFNVNGEIYRNNVPINGYSTTEQIIGTWIDGKPIYRKVFSNITIPNDTTSYIPHGISNFDQLIDLKAKWYDTVDDRWRVNPRYSSSASTASIAFMCNNTNLIVQGSGTNWSIRTNNCTAVLEYTKTTD